ncbi:MAG: permease-like cell division protein FtsX [Candidatus Dojkabacteria bacterium]|nr:permease-like cell division protein FtsX [Candidatus Dojkabacteria bacterium]
MTKTGKIFDSAKKNIKRNKWLSLSTIFVSSIVIGISSFFISVALIANKAVSYYEQKAQVIIFFKKEAKEADILTLRDKLFDPELVEDITYVSQSEALEIYKEDFADNPDLISTVTADSLPPSLEIRAKSVDDLITVIDRINVEKQTNANIDEVMYFKDVVENLKSLSNIINISALILITSLLIITFSLIRITIGFNINSHKDEIQIMNLVGSTGRYIRMPFIIEGAFYGIAGGFIAATVILTTWYIVVGYAQNTEFSYWVNQLLFDFKLDFLRTPNIVFIPIYYLVHIVLGGILGIVSSFSAVKKYLKE